ncbi:unnamed protein product [Protopolystoma xenopodis]|uniref:C2H2-type domain-containing protein n=1 Tax=Protopolystoma xenopodis TaxID=117903 RepID=A0A3S5A2N2_9PLAT|nr:unnamed protein product [Protopolystoma xenopodis]
MVLSSSKRVIRPPRYFLLDEDESFFRAKVSKIEPKIISDVDDGMCWQCWQCTARFPSNDGLIQHIELCPCSKIEPIGGDLRGCPFCPRSGNHTLTQPFQNRDFNYHLQCDHPNVASLSCPYCLKMFPSRIEALASHIILDHQVHWWPTPASLGYLRFDEVPHRVVTCLGCNWCTFVLRANCSVSPPASMQAHMGRCIYQGGQVVLTRFSESTLFILGTPGRARDQLIRQLTRESVGKEQLFSSLYPYTRNVDRSQSSPGFMDESPERNGESPHFDGASPNILINEQPNTSTTSPMTSSNPEIKQVETLTPAPNKNLPQDIIATSKPIIPTPIIFDVPLDLPPPPRGLKRSAGHPNKVFVCPICGDKSLLGSLRERDEHLQAEHNGELCFPCQLCGLAYPLYIALRRHAVLRHHSDFDSVLYGRDDLLDCEPVDCPHCQLVAFTDPNVLHLHLYRVHRLQVTVEGTIG